MPSCNTYHLTWVSLTLGVGYLFTAAPAKHSRCSLPWMRGISLPPPFLTFNVGWLLQALLCLQPPPLGLLLPATGPGLGGRRLRAGSLSTAERSYPTFEVRGSSLECQAATAQERPRGATLCPRSGAASERSYPVSEVSGSGREELPRVGGQGQPGDTTSHRRPGVVTLRSHPEPEARAGGREEQPEEWWLRRHRRA